MKPDYVQEMREVGINCRAAQSCEDLNWALTFLAERTPVGTSGGAEEGISAYEQAVEFVIAETLANPLLPILWLENRRPILRIMNWLPRSHRTFWDGPTLLTEEQIRAVRAGSSLEWLRIQGFVLYPTTGEHLTCFTPLPEFLRQIAYAERDRHEEVHQEVHQEAVEGS